MQLNSSITPSKKLVFTPAELERNRIGQLSDKQRKAIRFKYRLQTAFSLFFLSIFIAFGVWFLVTRQNYIVGVPLLLISAYMGYAFVNLGRILVDDLHVQKTTGYLEKEAIVENDHTFYYFRVNDVMMRVSREVFESFPDDDPAAYTFYYLQRTNDVVSDVPTPISYERIASDALSPRYKK